MKKLYTKKKWTENNQTCTRTEFFRGKRRWARIRREWWSVMTGQECGNTMTRAEAEAASREPGNRIVRVACEYLFPLD